MRPATLLIHASLFASKALTVPTTGNEEISHVPTTIDIWNPVDHAAGNGVEKRRLEKRATYLASCPSFTTPEGRIYMMAASRCMYGVSTSAYRCDMRLVGAPDQNSHAYHFQINECFPNYICVAGQQAPDGLPQAYCQSKAKSHPINMPNPGSTVVEGAVKGAAVGGTTATVVIMDPTLTDGVNVSEIQMQPMSLTPIGLYPYGPKTVCENADACSLYNVPPETVQLKMTLTFVTAVTAAMVMALTG